jgi:diaminohydroxyphosphoribosylaminopyrimidine deaminase/5-amino-6-(5-phosphoribosylamino)uracil reductase
VKSAIKRVVVGMKDPNPKVAGGGLAFLESHGIETTVGVLEQACKGLNEAFIKYITTSLPFVTMKSAATLDGRTATRTGNSKWITNPESRKFVHEIRHEVDAIMVGIGTVKADDPRLTTRLEGKKGYDPIRVILDTRLSISPKAKILHLATPSDTLIVTSHLVSGDKKKAIEKLGAKVLSLENCDDAIDLKALMVALGKMEITSLLIEGGSKVHGSALRAGIVDKVYMFYAPKIYGGDDGTPVCSGPGKDQMDACVHLENISVRRFMDDVMIEGYIIK